MYNKLFVFIFLLIIGVSCNRNTSRSDSDKMQVNISVTNPLKSVYNDALVEIDIKEIYKDCSFASFDSFALVNDTFYPFQLIDEDNNDKPDKLLFLCSLEPEEEKKFSFGKTDRFIPVFEKRTQAEISVKQGGEWKDRKYIGGNFKNIEYLRVPPEHTDHSLYIRYEGPGWESDLVGYRFYLDWRNAIDIFGKKVDTVVLQNVGQDGFDSYHEPEAWGMDILKVGNSLGMGSIGIWHNRKADRVAVTDSITCEIIQNGLIQSAIKTKYYGWQAGNTKTDLTSVLSIHAGSRMTEHQLYLSEEIDNICTGIVKNEMAEIIEPDIILGEWTYFATWGMQSLANDNLGMAVFYKSGNLIELSEDKESLVIILKPDNKELKYYLAAAWENEKNGIKNINEFKEYLETTIIKLDNPLILK